MYNGVGGSGGILPLENLNFQNLRNAIFGLLALMFALLQKLSLLNLQAIFLVTPPLHTTFFWLAPTLKPYFFTWPPLKSHQPPLPQKNERSLSLMFSSCNPCSSWLAIRSQQTYSFRKLVILNKTGNLNPLNPQHHYTNY